MLKKLDIIMKLLGTLLSKTIISYAQNLKYIKKS